MYLEVIPRFSELDTAACIGSITSRCSGKWACTQRPDQGDCGNEAYWVQWCWILVFGKKSPRMSCLLLWLKDDYDNDDDDVFLLNRIIFKTTHVQLQSVARRLQSKMEIYSYASRWDSFNWWTGNRGHGQWQRFVFSACFWSLLIVTSVRKLPLLQSKERLRYGF